MTPPELAGYRPVSPAEAREWAEGHPMAEYLLMAPGGDCVRGRIDDSGCCQFYSSLRNVWTLDRTPFDDYYLYYIPKQTPEDKGWAWCDDCYCKGFLDVYQDGVIKVTDTVLDTTANIWVGSFDSALDVAEFILKAIPASTPEVSHE